MWPLLFHVLKCLRCIGLNDSTINGTNLFLFFRKACNDLHDLRSISIGNVKWTFVKAELR